MKTIARWLYRKLFNVKYMLMKWDWEHQEKIQLLRNELLEDAISKLGYELEMTIKADYLVEGQLPNAQREFDLLAKAHSFML